MNQISDFTEPSGAITPPRPVLGFGNDGVGVPGLTENVVGAGAGAVNSTKLTA